jgi:C-terminal processing protease CtpA/Prc
MATVPFGSAIGDNLRMRVTWLVLVIGGCLSAQVKLANPSFEAGAVGGPPVGWNGGGGGFTIDVTDQGCRTGRCAVMAGSETLTAPFGNLSQAFSTDGYRLRQIRFRAAVRVAGEGTRAQLWLRLDRADGSVVFLENMSMRPITSAEWREYDIATAVPTDASRMIVGVLQFGPGKAWVDDVSLEITGELIQDKVEPARPLTARGLTNLTAFAKLYGYVRHFHPSEEAAAADWETVALEGVRKVEGAADAAELAARLREVFGTIAPRVQVFAGERPAPAPALEGPLVRYKHRGVGLTPAVGRPTGAYFSPIQTIEAGETAPKPFEAELGGGVRTVVPLTAKAAADGARAAGARPTYERTGDDRTTRLAAVIIAWNVFQHFYPYFDVVKTDWAAELPKALRSAAADADKFAFTGTLRRLVAALHDGHGYVNGPARGAGMMAPITMDWVEGQFLVTRVPQGTAEGVAPGDRVLEIDGVPVEKLAAAARAESSAATEGFMRHRVTGELSRCNAETRTMRLTLEPIGAGERKMTQLLCGGMRSKDPERYTEPRPTEKITELEAGIFYVDLDRVEQKEFDASVPRLEKAKGIIFDMRGYPGQPGITSLAHLTDSALRSAKWNVPSPGGPDQTDVKWFESGWPVAPQKPYFAAKRVFLIDGRAISYAETVMGIVEHFRLGEIVGEPTAGTNGNVNPFQLPGGYRVSWTGMKVLKHDGSQHHGIGIRPTVPVSRTRKGVAEKKDEIFLKGLEVVKR